MRTNKRKISRRKKTYYIRNNKCEYNIFQIWQMIITVIEPQISKIAFQTWFSEAMPVVLVSNNVLIIRVHNQIVKDTLDKNYLSLIKEASRKIGYNLKFAFIAV